MRTIHFSEDEDEIDMALSLTHRQVGDITVIACAGRIVEGDESAALNACIDGLAPRRYFVLHLGEVTFVDSSGLGLLVRLLMRTRNSQGDLKLCSAPANVTEVLRVTQLDAIFDLSATEGDAITAFYQPRKQASADYRFATDILCADVSEDVLVYVGRLLQQAGYGVVSASNLTDAVILLSATRPRVVVAGHGMRAVSGTRSAETFARLVQACTVIDLPRDFSNRDAGAAGVELLGQVRAALGPDAPSSRATV